MGRGRFHPPPHEFELIFPRSSEFPLFLEVYYLKAGLYENPFGEGTCKEGFRAYLPHLSRIDIMSHHETYNNTLQAIQYYLQ